MACYAFFLPESNLSHTAPINWTFRPLDGHRPRVKGKGDRLFGREVFLFQVGKGEGVQSL